MIANTRRRLFIGIVALLGAAPAYVANAQTYPTGTIKIIVGTGPAAPPDIISRVIANELSQSEGWTVVVENSVGAMQMIAAQKVAKSEPDGLTLWVTGMVATAAPALMPKLPVDVKNDFVPVVPIAKSSNVLVVTPDLPAKSLPELIAHLKAHPDSYNFGSGGNGTPAHLVGEMFKLETGTKAVHVPFQNPGALFGDIIAGRVQFGFITTLPLVDLIKAGKLRALAMTSEKRIAALPDVPTVTELGYPKLTAEDWTGLLARKGTPGATVEAINAAVNRALKKPNVVEALAKIGATPMGGSSDEFARFYSSELTHWADIVQRADIKIE
jgi:tripartite-type tricarboxylate transporter receptor subunit TctC